MTTTPSRTRYRVVALATGLAMITYLDRACLATLAPGIVRDLGLSTVQMGFVFTAFQLAYALFEIPTAWWADRQGTRAVLSRIVLWWSCLTAATGAAFSYPVLLGIRFLFGMGEAGAWPCVARTFSRWIPVRERGTVQGIFFAGAHLTGGLTPVLVLWMLHFMSWRAIFVCFGAVGFVWVAIWHTWFRNDPSEHPAVNAAELQTIRLGAAARQRPLGWMGVLGRAASQQKHGRDVPHVHPQLHDLLLLHHLASDIPEAAARVRRHEPRVLRRPAAHRQHARRLAGWTGDGSAGHALRPAHRAVRLGGGGVCDCRPGAARRGRLVQSGPRRRAHRAGDRHDDVHARRGLGHGDRGRTQPRRPWSARR